MNFTHRPRYDFSCLFKAPSRRQEMDDKENSSPTYLSNRYKFSEKFAALSKNSSCENNFSKYSDNSSEISTSSQNNNDDIAQDIISCDQELIVDQIDNLELISESCNNSGDLKLTTPWTMYFKYSTPGKVKGWRETDTEVLNTFSTVGEFWKTVNHMELPSKIKVQINPNIIMFREHIQPNWEDPANQNGAMWKITLNDKPSRAQLDILWLETLLICIGEIIQPANYITGVVVQRRPKEDRIQLWTRNYSDKTIQHEIGQQFKAALNITDGQIHCVAHDQNQTRGSGHQSWGRVRQQDEYYTV